MFACEDPLEGLPGKASVDLPSFPLLTGEWEYAGLGKARKEPTVST